jgi:hypothetical protein
MGPQVNNPNEGEPDLDLDLDGLDDDVTEDARGDAPDADSSDGEAPESSLDYDDSEIPENLKPVWEKHTKGYKAAYTRKTQELAAIRREAEKRLTDSGELAYKAAQLEQLMGIPAVQDAIRNTFIQAGGSGNVAEEQGRTQSGTPAGQVDPSQARIDRLEAQLRQENIRREADKFKDANPDWTKYQEAMQQAWRENPNLRPKEAYEIAKLRNWQHKISESKKKRAPKAAPNVEAPGNPRETALHKENMTFEEAFAAAQREAGKLG